MSTGNNMARNNYALLHWGVLSVESHGSSKRLNGSLHHLHAHGSIKAGWHDKYQIITFLSWCDVSAITMPACWNLGFPIITISYTGMGHYNDNLLLAYKEKAMGEWWVIILLCRKGPLNPQGSAVLRLIKGTFWSSVPDKREKWGSLSLLI